MESDINRENEIMKSVMAVGFLAEKFTPDFKYVFLREQFVMKTKLRSIKSGSGKVYLVAKPFWLREYKIKGMVFPEELIQRFDERVADHSGQRYNVYRAEWRFLFLKSHLQVLATILPTIAPLFNDEQFEGDGLNHKMQVLRLASDVPYISQSLEKLTNGMVQLSSVLEAILNAVVPIYNNTDAEDLLISEEFVGALLIADDLAQLMLQGLNQLLAQYPQLPQELSKVLLTHTGSDKPDAKKSKDTLKIVSGTVPTISELKSKDLSKYDDIEFIASLLPQVIKFKQKLLNLPDSEIVKHIQFFVKDNVKKDGTIDADSEIDGTPFIDSLAAIIQYPNYQYFIKYLVEAGLVAEDSSSQPNPVAEDFEGSTRPYISSTKPDAKKSKNKSNNTPDSGDKQFVTLDSRTFELIKAEVSDSKIQSLFDKLSDINEMTQIIAPGEGDRYLAIIVATFFDSSENIQSKNRLKYSNIITEQVLTYIAHRIKDGFIDTKLEPWMLDYVNNLNLEVEELQYIPIDDIFVDPKHPNTGNTMPDARKSKASGAAATETSNFSIEKGGIPLSKVLAATPRAFSELEATGVKGFNFGEGMMIFEAFYEKSAKAQLGPKKLWALLFETSLAGHEKGKLGYFKNNDEDLLSLLHYLYIDEDGAFKRDAFVSGILIDDTQNQSNPVAKTVDGSTRPDVGGHKPGARKSKASSKTLNSTVPTISELKSKDLSKYDDIELLASLLPEVIKFKQKLLNLPDSEIAKHIQFFVKHNVKKDGTIDADFEIDGAPFVDSLAAIIQYPGYQYFIKYLVEAGLVAEDSNPQSNPAAKDFEPSTSMSSFTNEEAEETKNDAGSVGYHVTTEALEKAYDLVVSTLEATGKGTKSKGNNAVRGIAIMLNNKVVALDAFSEDEIKAFVLSKLLDGTIDTSQEPWLQEYIASICLNETSSKSTQRNRAGQTGELSTTADHAEEMVSAQTELKNSKPPSNKEVEDEEVGEMSDELTELVYNTYTEAYNKLMVETSNDKLVSHVKALRVLEARVKDIPEVKRLLAMGYGLADLLDSAIEESESPNQQAEEALTSEIPRGVSIEVVPEGFTVADLGKGQAAESAISSEVSQHENEPSAVSSVSNPIAEVVEKDRPVEPDSEVPKEQVSDTSAVAAAPREVSVTGDVEPEPSPDQHGLTLPVAEVFAQSEMEAGTGGVAENSETDLSADKAKPAKDAARDRQSIIVTVVNDADFERFQSTSNGIPTELNGVPAAAIVSLQGEVKMDKAHAQTILTHYNTMHRMLLSESKQELGYVKTAHSQAIRWVMNKYKGDKYVAGIAREVGGFPSLIQLLQKVLE